MSRLPRSSRAPRNIPPPLDADTLPSKTRLKNEMHTLQALGERLADLSPDKLAELALPDALVVAINDYRRFTKWEALRRQMQYIGRLMRDIDAEPIFAKLDAWSHTSRESVASFHTVETWRDRLLAEPAALTEFVAAHPQADAALVAELIGRAKSEREGGRPPASSRLLFREIAKLIG